MIETKINEKLYQPRDIFIYILYTSLDSKLEDGIFCTERQQAFPDLNPANHNEPSYFTTGRTGISAFPPLLGWARLG
jgi:hypothetical protein